MDIPTPCPGLIVRYAYLWANEHAKGQEEGSKDRPVAVIAAVRSSHNRLQVAVLPITHTMPANPDYAVEIPQLTKQRLGLDDDQSWIVLTEINIFAWPGPDLRPVASGSRGSCSFGHLPDGFFRMVRDRYVALAQSGGTKSISRTE